MLNEVLASYPRTREVSRAISHLGVTVATLVGAEDSQALTLLDYTAVAGAPGPVPHFHLESSEWFYVLEGQFTFEIEGREVKAGAGSLTLVPPRTIHRFWNSAPASSRQLIGFNRPGMEQYFEELFAFVRSQPSWPPKDIAGLEAIAERYDTFSPGKL